MRITYQLDSTDIEAFLDHAQRASPLRQCLRWPTIALLAISLIVINLRTVFGDRSFIEKAAQIVISSTLYAILVISGILLFHYLVDRGRRRVIKDEANAFRLLPHTLDIDGDGLQESNEHESIRISWKVVTRTEEDMERFFIYWGTSQAIIVPKRAFKTTADLYRFTALIGQSCQQPPQTECIPEARPVDVEPYHHQHADVTDLSHSGYGISSFIISLVSSVLWIGMIIVITLIPVAALRESPLKAIFGLYYTTTICVALLAVFLGFIGVFQKRTKRTLAFLGMIIGVLPLIMIIFFILIGAASS